MRKEVIRTHYLNQILKYKDIDLIKVITGMRRVGKSYLLRQYRSVLESMGIPKDRILYIDMDSKSNERYKDGSLIYSEVGSRGGRGTQYILLDEVQLIDDWMRWIESLRNDMDCDLYITGSNAYMLSSDISTLLTGRSITITVLPLSLKEMCTLYEEPDCRTVFLRYFRHGGLPILNPDYSEEVVFQLIGELKSDIILKDILNRRPGIDTIKLSRVIDYLYSEMGNPISVTRMSRTLGISASSAGEYLQLATDSMLFMKVDRYDLKGKNLLSQEPKYYCTDTGMRYSQPMSADRDFGKTLEAIVYLELRRRYNRVYIGKPKNSTDRNDRHLEIDFIVMKDDSIDYYQVAQTLSDPETYEREFRPLRKITGRGERYIITYDDRPTYKGPDAIVMNIVEFLMDGKESSTTPPDVGIIHSTLYDMLVDYIKACSNISRTVVTKDNFDVLSGELQEKFFDLQAFFRRPELIEDDFLQERLARIRMNNVRIFDAMIGCVNANKEPIYKPAVAGELSELTGISVEISKHIVSGPGTV